MWQPESWSSQTEQERFSPKIADGLPELCFSTLRNTGQLICIKRGETGYYPSEWDTGDKERNVELADELNEHLGVTPIQRQAMEIGSLAGWDVPGADPAKYQENYPKMGGKMCIRDRDMRLEQLDELAENIRQMDQEDGALLKYLSVLDVEQPATLQEALKLSIELDDYEMCIRDSDYRTREAGVRAPAPAGCRIYFQSNSSRCRPGR